MTVPGPETECPVHADFWAKGDTQAERVALLYKAIAGGFDPDGLIVQTQGFHKFVEQGPLDKHARKTRYGNICPTSGSHHRQKPEQSPDHG